MMPRTVAVAPEVVWMVQGRRRRSTLKLLRGRDRLHGQGPAQEIVFSMTAPAVLLVEAICATAAQAVLHEASKRMVLL